MGLAETLKDLIAHYGYFAVFAIVALESAGIPLPGETALLTAAIFAGDGALNLFGVIGAVAASRFIAHHADSLRDEAEKALPGPLFARNSAPLGRPEP